MNHVFHLLPIAATGVIAAAIIFERSAALFFRLSIDARLFLGKIEALVAKNEIQAALELCAAHEKGLLARVVKAGLLVAERDEREVRTSMEVALLECSSLATQRIGYLAMIANVATLLGLLGTIGGLIASFEAVASADAATKQSLLASGISVSMNATALGLIVAIPTMIAYSVLHGRANRIIDELERGAGRVISLLQGRVYSLDAMGCDDFSKPRYEEAKGAA